MKLKLISKHSVDSTLVGTRRTVLLKLRCRGLPVLQRHETNRNFGGGGVAAAAAADDDDDDDDDNDIDIDDFISLVNSGYYFLGCDVM
jgi:hypothetical protein